MFQVPISPNRRSTASALTVLAAIGASGMTEQATAAVATHELSMAARAPNSSYAYLQWQNWLTATNWSPMGDPPDAPIARGFLAWNIDFNAGAITDAKIRISKNNNSSAYGLPAGAHLEFGLITDLWTSSTPKPFPDLDGPDIEESSKILVAAPSDLVFEVDVTSLLQIWQANPGTYHGIRFWSPDSTGGVVDPNNTDVGRGGITGDLVLTTTEIPEPALLGLLSLGGALGLRRRQA